MLVSSAHRFYLTAAICRTQRHYIHWSLASRKFSAYSSSKTLGSHFCSAGRDNRKIPPSMDKLEDEELVFPEFVAQGKEEESVDYELRLQKACEERIHVEQLERTKVEAVGAELYHQTLQQQVKSLQPLFKKLETKEIKSKKDLSDNIEINDLGFTPILHNTNLKRKSTKIKREHKIYGSPDSSLPISGHPCSGCGAIMHCLEPTIPGYIPSEKYSSILEQNTNMKNVTCQRCFLLVHHQKALNVTVSQEEYRNIVSNIREKKALVLLMVDMLDIPNTIIPDLLDLVGETKNIFVLGNKIDLLPGDSPGYLKRLKGQLQEYCTKRGLNRAGNMNDVHLISAKTGYGVEELITKLQRSWKYNGDVYLVGATNTGKSTLFNGLLQSDYCKAKASEIIRGATISPWPGTTLNLLKFPIVNPTPYRMFRRQERLKLDMSISEEDLGEEEQNRLNSLKKRSYVIGRIGRTFHKKQQQEDIDFDADLLSINIEDEANCVDVSHSSLENVEFTYNELKDAHWFYDTPGILKEGCLLNHLSDKEIKAVQPTSAIIPRTFILQPSMTLFLGALGRIDFLQGEKSAWFTVIASNLLPVQITSTDKADDLYQKHAGKTLLGVPIGGERRMNEFPSLVPQDIRLEGIGASEAVADIMLSTAGWVAVTAHLGQQLHLRCYTPKGTLLAIRKPPLLPFVVNIKGERLKKSPAYATKMLLPLVKNMKSHK